jgi:hypothetical protein
METILIVVTIVSLLVALVMGVMAWRVSRDERARTGARVAALAAAAAAQESSGPVVGIEPVTDVRVAPALEDFEPDPAPAASRRSAAAPAPARVSTPDSPPPAPAQAPEVALPALPSKQAAASIAHPFLNMDAPRPSEGRQRGLAVAAAVLFVMLGGGAYWLFSGSGTTREGTAATAATAPLELMSLRHERVGSRLTLAGLVRNPVAGAPVDGLAAVVFLFDANGTFITSARAGVDFTHLAAGDESPFVISMDAPSNVARYRVSFRTDSGILAHVDRRSEQSPATASVSGS